MKKIWLGLVFGLVFSSAWTAVFAAEPVVYDINGGFEKTDTWTKYEEQYRSWVQQGMQLPDPFIKPKDWYLQSFGNPKLEVITDAKEAHSGNNCLKLISGSIYYAGQAWLNTSLTGAALNADDRITLKVWVKGPADTPFLVQLYLYGVKKDGGRVVLFDIPKSPGDGKGGPGDIIRGKATPEWKQYTATYTVSDSESAARPGCRVQYVTPVLEARGVFFDDVEVQVQRSGSAESK